MAQLVSAGGIMIRFQSCLLMLYALLYSASAFPCAYVDRSSPPEPGFRGVINGRLYQEYGGACMEGIHLTPKDICKELKNHPKISACAPVKLNRCIQFSQPIIGEVTQPGSRFYEKGYIDYRIRFKEVYDVTLAIPHEVSAEVYSEGRSGNLVSFSEALKGTVKKSSSATDTVLDFIFLDMHHSFNQWSYNSRVELKSRNYSEEDWKAMVRKEVDEYICSLEAFLCSPQLYQCGESSNQFR